MHCRWPYQLRNNSTRQTGTFLCNILTKRPLCKTLSNAILISKMLEKNFCTITCKYYRWNLKVVFKMCKRIHRQTDMQTDRHADRNTATEVVNNSSKATLPVWPTGCSWRLESCWRLAVCSLHIRHITTISTEHLRLSHAGFYPGNHLWGWKLEAGDRMAIPKALKR